MLERRGAGGEVLERKGEVLERRGEVLERKGEVLEDSAEGHHVSEVRAKRGQRWSKD